MSFKVEYLSFPYKDCVECNPSNDFIEFGICEFKTTHIRFVGRVSKVLEPFYIEFNNDNLINTNYKFNNLAEFKSYILRFLDKIKHLIIFT